MDTQLRPEHGRFGHDCGNHTRLDDHSAGDRLRRTGIAAIAVRTVRRLHG